MAHRVACLSVSGKGRTSECTFAANMDDSHQQCGGVVRFPAHRHVLPQDPRTTLSSTT